MSVVAKDKLQNTASLNVLGQAVQISRSGGRTLNDQAALSLKVDSADLPNGTQPAIYYYNEARQSWVFIGGKTDTAGSITANVNHLGTFVVSSYAPLNLSDLSGHWAADYADRLLGMNVIQGYANGTFQPSKKITRAEFVTLLSKALALKSVESDTTFADQGNLPNWAKSDIAAAVQAGIVKGYGDNTFKPDRTITRAEMAVMVANALKASSEAKAGMSGNTSVKPSFNDASQTPSWAQEALDAAVQAKIVSGYTDHTVRAGSETTRAEAVTMIYKLLLALHV